MNLDPPPSIVAGPAASFSTHLYPPAYKPSTGCAVCGSPDTVTLTLREGRRCSEHKPRFNPAHAVALHVGGFPWAALAYVRWAEAA